MFGPIPVLKHRLFCGVLLLLSFSLEAILFKDTADPNHNTSAPSGELADSGWQYQGAWGNFLGTAIAAHYFITARHVGGAAGDPFFFGGVAYPTTAFFDDPNSDLRIWRVCGALPVFAPLYSASEEMDKPVVVFGRGTQRGSEVFSADLTPQSKGWAWGLDDARQRWGQNKVTAIVDASGIGPLRGLGGATAGQLLKCEFNNPGVPNEAHLSAGDSGGAVFIQDGGIWNLAGINYGVDGPYNTIPSGSGFQAAIFDEGGLYKGGEGRWVFTPDLPFDRPGAFYATRISSSFPWITGVLANAAPELPVLQRADQADGPYADVAGAVVDSSQKTITTSFQPPVQFFRLRSCGSLRFRSVQIADGKVVLGYE